MVRSVEDLNISLTESHDYTGSAIDPQLSVTELETGYKLQKDIDYTVIYKDAAGEAVSVIQEAEQLYGCDHRYRRLHRRSDQNDLCGSVLETSAS